MYRVSGRAARALPPSCVHAIAYSHRQLHDLAGYFKAELGVFD